MERTNERFGSTQGYGERQRPIGGSYGYEAEALEYGSPYGEGYEQQQPRGRRRRRGIIRRMAQWVGSTLQEWAETGARQMERAGERARELTEEGGSRAQRWADRGEHEARHWSRRAGASMERAGGRMERTGEDLRQFGSPEREGRFYGRGQLGMGRVSYGYGVGREPSGMRQGMGRGGEYGESQGRGGESYGEPYGYGFGQEGRGEGNGGERGRFAGRGPRGYRRSDERILEDVCDSLSSGIIDASDIEVKVDDGEVTLTGEVERRDWKHIAEDMASDVNGVRDIHNRIRVRREERAEQGERGEQREPQFHSEGTQPQH